MNVLYSLLTVNNQTVTPDVVQKIDMNSLSHAISNVQTQSQEAVLKDKEATMVNMSRTYNFNLNLNALCADMGSGLNEGPSQPIMAASFICNQAHQQDSPPPLSVQAHSLSLSNISADRLLTPHSLLQPSKSQRAASQIVLNKIECNNTEAQLAAVEDHTVQSNSLIEVGLAGTHLLLNPPKMTKGRSAPTRRSQRLQDKHRFSTAAPRPPAKAKTQSSKIIFTPDFHLSPLHASKAMEILQATGLLINAQIEDIVQAAVSRDQDMGTSYQLMPQTPLHDLLPPLTVPGTDIIL